MEGHTSAASQPNPSSHLFVVPGFADSETEIRRLSVHHCLVNDIDLGLNVDASELPDRHRTHRFRGPIPNDTHG